MDMELDTYSSEDTSLQIDPALQLDHERRRNDLKLKGTFEHIFAKYSKDFTQIGDEIDLETGRVVVNNGHLARMQHERDVGANTTSRFVKAFAEDLEEDSTVDSDSEQDELSSGHYRLASSASSRRTTPKSTAKKGTLNGSESRLQAKRISFHGSPTMDSRFVGDVVPDSCGESETSDDFDARQEAASEPDVSALTQGILSNVPSIQDSLTALVPSNLQPGQPLTIDPAAIQSLGKSIADQIARFLARIGSPILLPDSHDPWSAPPLPQDAFVPQRLRGRPRLLTPSPQSTPADFQSPAGGQSLWAPAPTAVAKRMRKKRKIHRTDDTSVANIRLRKHEPVRQPAGAENDIVDTIPNTGNQITPYQEIRSSGARFTQEEDALIKRLRDVRQLTWREIARRLPGRNVDALYGRYVRAIRHLSAPQASPQDNTTTGTTETLIENNTDEDEDMATKQSKRFTKEDDELIVHLRDVEQMTFLQIARQLSRRSPETVRARYHRLSQGDLVVELEEADQPNGGLIRQFSRREDELIKYLRDVKGLAWKSINRRFPGRNVDTVKKRYYHKLREVSASQEPVAKREIVEILDDETVDVGIESSDTRDGDSPSSVATPLPRKHQSGALLREVLTCAQERRALPMAAEYTDHGYADTTDYASDGTPGAYQTWPQPQSDHFALLPWASPDDTRVSYRTYRKKSSSTQHARPQGPATYPTAATFMPSPARSGASVSEVLAAKAKGKTKHHDNRPSHPRYNRFDTTIGDGTFGMLKSDDSMPSAALPQQQQLLGPRTAMTGAFGVLKSAAPLENAEPTQLKRKRGRPRKIRPQSPEMIIEPEASLDRDVPAPISEQVLAEAPYFALAAAPADCAEDSDYGLFATPHEKVVAPTSPSTAYAGAPMPAPTTPLDGLIESRPQSTRRAHLASVRSVRRTDPDADFKVRQRTSTVKSKPAISHTTLRATRVASSPSDGRAETRPTSRFDGSDDELA